MLSETSLMRFHGGTTEIAAGKASEVPCLLPSRQIHSSYFGSLLAPVLASQPQAPRCVIRPNISRASVTQFLVGSLDSSATKPTPHASLSLAASKRPCGGGIAECARITTWLPLATPTGTKPATVGRLERISARVGTSWTTLRQGRCGGVKASTLPGWTPGRRVKREHMFPNSAQRKFIHELLFAAAI